jgi:hypothetical protein
MSIKDDILAGDAVFTVSNSIGTRYTYRVRRDGRGLLQASLLTGSGKRLAQLGVIDVADGTLRLSGADLDNDATSVRVLHWALTILWAGKLFPSGYRCHAGIGRDARRGGMRIGERIDGLGGGVMTAMGFMTGD